MPTSVVPHLHGPHQNLIMSPTPLRQLEEIIRERKTTAAERDQWNAYIADCVFATSPFLTEPGFRSFHPDDIKLLYELYDENYFSGHLGRTLVPKLITFRLSGRMTRAGGKTTRWTDRLRRRDPWYEITIATTLLFQSFQDPEREITVSGLPCHTRMDGLMRIMEHELVHLIEMLIWTDSSCAMHRFQGIASRNFGHTDHRHNLITPKEVAVRQYGVRPGMRVRFDMEGHAYEGIVNRITKRATVLVADPGGAPYSDGKRYMTFYVPVAMLEVVE